ncbi:MAG: hypothetical protein WAJ92_03355 [Candidatus Acidiferrales bacterium]
MRQLNSPSTKRIAARILAVALIFMVGALGLHALVHNHDNSYDEQHCQVCHIGHVAVPLPAAQTTLQAPAAVARFSALPASIFDFTAVCEHSSPRAPPA